MFSTRISDISVSPPRQLLISHSGAIYDKSNDRETMMIGETGRQVTSDTRYLDLDSRDGHWHISCPRYANFPRMSLRTTEATANSVIVLIGNIRVMKCSRSPFPRRLASACDSLMVSHFRTGNSKTRAASVGIIIMRRGGDRSEGLPI
jgi:hypothetical protein